MLVKIVLLSNGVLHLRQGDTSTVCLYTVKNSVFIEIFKFSTPLGVVPW